MKKRFIFDESYNKKHNKKDFLRLLLIIGGIVLAIVIVIIIVMLILKNSNSTVKPKPKNEPYYEFKDELIIESGDNLPDVYDYFKTIKNVSKDDIKISYPLEMEFAYDKTNC